MICDSDSVWYNTNTPQMLELEHMIEKPKVDATPPF
jgi:hypothetical protein